MRKSFVFWGSIIILIGVLSAVGQLFPEVALGKLAWPLLLIALGVWFLWGVLAGPQQAAVETEEASVPLEGANEGRVSVKFGAGRLRVTGGAGPDELASGAFGGGVRIDARRDGDTLDATLRSPATVGPIFVVPWLWGPSNVRDWQVRLTGRVPLSLVLDTGACDAHVDLTGLHVTDVRLNTGASSSEITAPANAGHTRIEVHAGAASVRVRVPEGVAARVRSRGGLTSLVVDRKRFPRAGAVYQSPGYETAANKVDVYAETGVGSIEVR